MFCIRYILPKFPGPSRKVALSSYTVKITNYFTINFPLYFNEWENQTFSISYFHLKGCVLVQGSRLYEACPGNKATKVLNMYNIFNLQKRLWMNCLYITLFFNIVAGIVQTFIKSWNQLLYPRVTEVLPPALWNTSWLLLASHHRRRNFSQRDVSLGEETSGNRWVRGPATICLWISAGRSHFALRNRMTERNSHLAGLWIGAAISNTSHSNKAGSANVKRARLTGKVSRSTAVLP